MRVACTGSEGMLGTALRRVFSDGDFQGFTYETLDVTDLDSVIREVKAFRPDLLIHAAAYTDVDGCEKERDRAFSVNGIGARNAAIACEEVRCPVVYISTDYVFDGEKGEPYDEWDKTNPLNVYGESKHFGEQLVMSMTNRYYVVRTSWLFGPNGNHFVDTIIRLLAERDRLQVVNDQRGSPTYTLDLAAKIRELTGRGYGIYHVTNSGSCTWYDFAVAISGKTGMKKAIEPVSSEEFRRPARRPSNSVLGNAMLRIQGMECAVPWERALDAYLESRR